MDLTLLAPDIQEQILFAESVDGVEPMSEREMRVAARLTWWAFQRTSSLAVSEVVEVRRLPYCY